MKDNYYNQKGFTLVEMLVSVFIIAFSLIGIFNLNTKYNQQTLQEKESFVATLLAQEAIEIIKNTRDTNSISNLCWLSGITEDPTSSTCQANANWPSAPDWVGSNSRCIDQGCEIDYNGTGGNGSLGFTPWGYAYDPAEVDPSGGHELYMNPSTKLYGYDTANAIWTPYRRRIVVSYPSLGDTDIYNRIDIKVIVYWKGKKIEVMQQMYNWRGDPE